MQTLTTSVLSTELIPVKVTATINGQSTYNPTGDTIQMAFMTTGNPAPSDWKAATWQIVVQSAGPVYIAQCLVGPGVGGVALAVGIYAIWVKITDSPEVPVRQVGILQIT